MHSEPCGGHEEVKQDTVACNVPEDACNASAHSLGLHLWNSPWIREAGAGS